MHEDELDVSPELVHRLMAAQFPALLAEPIVRVPSWGTVHAMFRIGRDRVARMPFTPTWGDPAAEAETLRRLAGRLPARIPRVLGVGTPTGDYPREWLVLDWIDGRPVAPGSGGEPLADDLAALLRALQETPTDAAPAAYRGGDLHRLDGPLRECLDEASDLIDVTTLVPVWEDALAAPVWHRDPVWVHSDLLAGNVLLDDRGRLAGALDWESAGVGDPACDLMVAWSVLDASGRMRLRKRLELDEATWRRGRAWALAQAAFALPYYRDTNPEMASHSRRVLAALSAADRPA